MPRREERGAWGGPALGPPRLLPQRMQVGATVPAGHEAGGRGLLAMREEPDLSERSVQDAAARRQAVLVMRIGIVVVHRGALDARGPRVHRHALDPEQALLEA